MNKKVYKKLLKVREAEDMSLAPCTYLKEEIETPTGKVPFNLRNYQIQMVYHMLMMKRFVCGDATGLGKCSGKNSMISTTYGLVEIGDMHDYSDMKPDTFEPIDKKWEVLVDGEALPVKNFYYGGVKPTIKVGTRYGFEVEGSKVHPLLVWRDCEHQWIETRDLQEGDYVCVERREMSFPDEEPVLDTDVTTKGNSETYSIPNKMTPEFARLFGYYIGEGSLTSHTQFRLSQCPVINPDIHSDIIGLIDKIFDTEPKHIDQADLCVNSTYIRRFLYQNGLDYTTSHDRDVPDCILQSTRESNRQFLRGIFEGEGHVNASGIEFSTASEELGRQLQIMLLRFGIVSNRSSKKVKSFGHNDYWRLTIFGKDAHIFKDKIGFVSSRKQDKLKQVLNTYTNSNHDVLPDSKPLIEDLRALLKDALTRTGSNENRKGSGFKQYGKSFVSTLCNIRNIGRNPSYKFLQEFLTICKENGLENTDPYFRLETLLDTQYFYDPVVTLEEGEAEVFDIEVDDPKHCFIANGLVNHNTLESIATQCYLWEKESDLVPIVVTKTSAMRQWGGEIDKFCDGVGWTLVEGKPEERYDIYEEFFEEWDPDHPSFLIVNYHRLARDKRHFQACSEGHRTTLYWDECTAFKSSSTKTHKVAKQITEAAERAYGLTATLIKNNLEEGYGIYKVLRPELFRTKKGFHRDYCITRKQRIPGRRKRYVKVIVGHKKEQIDKFRAKIDPYYLGRPKHLVATELPPLTAKEVYTPLKRSQWGCYQEALSGLLKVHVGTDDEEEKETTKLTQLMYCQEIVNSPHLIGRDIKSGKEEHFLSMIREQLSDEKVIVFTRFKTMVDRFQELLKEDGYGIGIEEDSEGKWVPKDFSKDDDHKRGLVRITGAESSEERDAGKNAFTENEDTNLIFLTMAGAEAINLQQARVMIFYDLPWSAGDYLQLVGRMIRIGSPHDRVYAIHLIGKGPGGEETIDHHVLSTLNKKMGWIERALGERLVTDERGKTEGEIMEIKTGSDTSDIFEKVKESALSLLD